MTEPPPLTSARFHVDWGGPEGSNDFLRVEFGAFTSVDHPSDSVSEILGSATRRVRDQALTGTGTETKEPKNLLAGQVVLTRRFTGDTALAEWVRKGDVRNVLVKVFRPDATPASLIVLEQVVAINWTLSSLDSMASALLTESVTLVADDLTVINS